MNYLDQISSLNYWQIVIGIVVILLALKFIDELWTWLRNKLGIKFKWDIEKSENANIVASQQNEIGSISESVSNISTEIESVVSSITKITDDIQSVSDRLDNFEETLEASRETNVMQLYDRLEQKTRYYIDTLHGIPSDELVGYKLLFEQYKRIGGNHGMDIKVQHALDTLPTISPSIFIMKQEEIEAAEEKINIK